MIRIRDMAATAAVSFVMLCFFAAPLVRAEEPSSTSPRAASPQEVAKDVRPDVGKDAAKDATKSVLEEKPLDAPPVFSTGVPADVADLRAMQEHVRKITPRLLDATVGIRVGAAHGSGVIVSRDGLVLTAAHVAQQPQIACDVTLPDGRVLRGQTLGLNRTFDAALVKINDAGPWPAVPMAAGDATKVGQWCLATGHPGGFEKGRKPVLRLGRVIESSDSLIVSDCTLVGGDSGGPLFDAQGQVIGVHSRIGGMLAANLHVPVGAYHRSWDRLLKGEAWGHLPGHSPFLGVRGAVDAQNARLSEVFPDSPAQQAGLRVGDIVVRFGEQPVQDFSSLSKLVAQNNPGDLVTLEVQRGNERLKLTVTLGKR